MTVSTRRVSTKPDTNKPHSAEFYSSMVSVTSYVWMNYRFIIFSVHVHVLLLSFWFEFSVVVCVCFSASSFVLSTWVVTSFNAGAYLTYISIYHKALNLVKFDCEVTMNLFLEPTSSKQ